MKISSKKTNTFLLLTTLLLISFFLLQFFNYKFEPGYIKHTYWKWKHNKPNKPYIKTIPKPNSKTFNIWTTGCSHTMEDFKKGRLPLAHAINQSEFGGPEHSEAFYWDIMLHLGDLSAIFTVPTEFQGRLMKAQLFNVRKHNREQIYNIMGNHDATISQDSIENSWFRKWIDPMGENEPFSGVKNSKRPFKVDGVYDHYSFTAGNLLFLMLSDHNELSYPMGRGKGKIGSPAGTVTREQFEWWKKMIENNSDKIIITCHHHMLKNTTIASGDFEGINYEYHTESSPADTKASSYLYFVGDRANPYEFIEYMAENPGRVALWIGAHTHVRPGEKIRDKTWMEKEYGTWFINSAALGRAKRDELPSSRLLTFHNQSNQVDVKYYIHGVEPCQYKGFDSTETRKIYIDKKFSY